jgi:hypothetical protein
VGVNIPRDSCFVPSYWKAVVAHDCAIGQTRAAIPSRLFPRKSAIARVIASSTWINPFGPAILADRADVETVAAWDELGLGLSQLEAITRVLHSLVGLSRSWFRLHRFDGVGEGELGEVSIHWMYWLRMIFGFILIGVRTLE